MARRRIAPASSPRGDDPRPPRPRLDVVLVDAARLVTLDSRGDTEDAELVKGALVRLRPAANTSPADVQEWRHAVVRAGARAVRVLPVQRDAEVALAAFRPRTGPTSPRAEVERILAEAADPDLDTFARAIMDEVKL